ncbi:MAG: endo-1,4-beta-xylanase [Verrucomicrobiales bacterium]|nr:endo-1,4-beta-xylanase [Verrucomicrobiales bacterium]
MIRPLFLSFLPVLCILPPVTSGAESVVASTNPPDSLVTLARNVPPDFQLGSFASGLDFNRPENLPLAEFFRRNFNIMTVGVYMQGTQRQPGAYNFESTDALIAFAQTNHLQVHLHPLEAPRTGLR